jgi:hypothetical protein
MAPAPAKALTFDTEGDAGNAYQDFRELFDFERVSRRGRLEDSVCAALHLEMVADAARRDRARLVTVDSRKEDCATGRKRVAEDQGGCDFIADCGVQNDRGARTISVARQKISLDEMRRGGGPIGRECVAAIGQDCAQIFLFVRHGSIAMAGAGSTIHLPRAAERAGGSRSG